MKPEVFVLSAGRAPEHDYRWKTEVDENHDLAAKPRERLGWLDDFHPSILVEREADGGFRVLVAGFATERRDYRGRTIRNAILWQNLTPDAARSLTLEFLRSQEALIARCNAAVVSLDDAPGGYAVDWKALQGMSVPDAPMPKREADSRCFEELSTPITLAETAALLAQSTWPADPTILVVITRLPSSSALRELRETGVWRFHHEQATRQELPPKGKPRTTPGLPTKRSEPDNDLRILGGVLLAGLVVCAIAFALRSNPTEPKKSVAPAPDGGRSPAPSPARSAPSTPSSTAAPALTPVPSPSPRQEHGKRSL